MGSSKVADMGFVVFIIAFVASAIGFFIANLINDEVSLDKLGNLDPGEINGLIVGLTWFVVCLVVYLSVAQLDNEKWFKLISPSFFFTWAFVSAGIILGGIMWFVYQDSTVTIDGDVISQLFFLNLAISLGPTASASLGLRGKD